MVALSSLIPYFTIHYDIAYLVLFLCSYFEILIGTGFFLYGEVFFIGGGILAGAGVLDIWWVYIWCVLGGILGDTSSFFIGWRWGPVLVKRFFKRKGRFLNRSHYDKSKAFFEKIGYKSIFMSRLMGPLAKVTPFFAGAFRADYRRFLIFNIPGVIIGIGELVFVGYFFGFAYTKVLAKLGVFSVLAVALVIICVIVYAVVKKRKARAGQGKTRQRGSS